MAEGSETILSWNFTNWVTVLLMASVGFFLLGIAQKWYSSKSASAAA